jgi:hypothetical protein
MDYSKETKKMAPPQINNNTNQSPIVIPKPMVSGATDNPNAPQSGGVGTLSSLENDASYFPLLSKSPGFADAMLKVNQSGDFDNDSTMPISLVMQRNLRTLESSDLYKGAEPSKRIAYQLAFFKKYVEPITRSTGTKVDFKEWLKDRGQYWQYQVNPKAQAKNGLIPDGIKTALTGTKEQNASAREAFKAVGGGVASEVLHVGKTALETKRAFQEEYINALQNFKSVSKTFSLGNALMNPKIAPYMAPNIFSKEYTQVREGKSEKKLDDYLSASDWFMENGFKQNLTNKIMYGAGEISAQVPLFMATDGVAEGMGLNELFGLKEATGMHKVALRSLEAGAQGYLIGTAEGKKNPEKEGLTWGVGAVFLGTGGHQVSEYLAKPSYNYLGSLFGWGGGKLLTPLVEDAALQVKNRSAAASVSPVTTALVGSPKQKISAAVIQSLNDLTGGSFYKAPDIAKKKALTKLSKIAPEFADQISFIDKNVTGASAAQQLIKQRSAVPEFDEVLKKLEKISGKPSHETVADAMHQKEATNQFRRNSDKMVQEIFRSPETREMISKDLASKTGDINLGRRSSDIVPGAASIKSLEFGDNLSKHIDAQLDKMGLGKNKIQFEDRKHKMLFFLNVLQSENRSLGPTKERNKLFQVLLNKLQSDFPGEDGRLPNLLAMSDKIWSDMEQASKAGVMKEGEIFRYWRQHSKPGQSPFSWEVELSQKAAKTDIESAKAAKEVSQKTPEQEQEEKLKQAFAKSTEGKRDTNVMKSALEEKFPGKKFAELTTSEQSIVAQRAGEIAKELNKRK